MRDEDGRNFKDEFVSILGVAAQHRRHAASLKLAGYFRVPSVMHYLIVDPNQPLIIHHARADKDAILTHVVRDGVITLDPPGLDLVLGDIYGAA